MSQDTVLATMRAIGRPAKTKEIWIHHNRIQRTKIKHPSTIGVSLRRLRKWGDVDQDADGRWYIQEEVSR